MCVVRCAGMLSACEWDVYRLVGYITGRYVCTYMNRHVGRYVRVCVYRRDVG